MLSRLSPKRVGAIGFGKSLLKPTSNEYVLKSLDENNSSLQGIALYHNKKSGVYVNAVKIDGDDYNFKKEYAQLEKKSKTSTSGANLFICSYPFNRVCNGIIG